ncbi:DNA polymerase III subunit gamma/tau [Proteiniphilum acetatigenes]|uniref:DNA polymerase III subunit gamma/tau n=1 Tax=Proteiniphilum acetatigenes TaxID=294710 RepID=UPI00035E6416|nr:DNA polymerase III subunit gamma/tau [Proteiniphilum acetatigenes]SFK54147.1 DNA polymerase-3 subunit gamma/tau [Porphyromonadaceae bacterium KH3CP3RA]
MDTFVVSARKYRPSTFKSVVGQEALTTTLKNAIAGNKLAHAYLFSGPRGVGKTTCARIFAKTINCLNPAADHEACNQCESCVAFNEQRSYNIHELDAASNNGVDDIRSLIDQVRVPPQIGRYKVYIIDEVHMLSQAAFNSFLKTLEEPPAHAIFILATTEKQKIIPTILSRCQVYDFNRITIADTVAHLQYVADQEGVKTEPEALNIIAQKADGGMRDALSIFDQTVSYTGGNITYQAVIENLNVLDYEYYFRLSDAILDGNVVDCLLILNDILNRGFEGQYIISGISNHFRDLLVCRDPLTAQLFQVGASIRERYIAMAQRCSNQFLYQAIEISNECDLSYRLSKNKRLLLELALIRLCQLSTPDGASAVKTEKKRAIEPIASKEKPTQTDIRQERAPEREKVSEREDITQRKTDSEKEDDSRKKDVSGTEPDVQKPAASSIRKPAEAAATLKKRTVSLAGMGVSLSSISNKKEEETSSSGTDMQQHNGNNLFTENELINAWKEYANNLNEEKLLKNTMTLYHPRMLSDTLFEVEVNTELNKQYLTDHSITLLSFLREKLKNGDITMTIRISEVNVIKKPLTSREIFDEMVQQNPSLQKLSDEFGLELS